MKPDIVTYGSGVRASSLRFDYSRMSKTST